MADGVAITAGSGTTILTDDTGAGGHAQVVKLAISTDGSGTLIPADATNGLDVDVTRLPALPAGTNNIGDIDVLTLGTWNLSGDTTLQNAVSATGNGSNMTVTGYSLGLIHVTGTFTATVTIEVSRDAGTTWTSLTVEPVGGSVLQDNITAAGLYRVRPASFDLLRARVTWSSGTSVTVVGRATNTTYTPRLLKALGNVDHDAVDSGGPVKVGAKAIAHGTNPTAVAAADRTDLYANRAGVPFVIGGHPNIVTLKHTNITTAVTDTAIITISSGLKIVVTRLTVTLDSASTVFPSVLIGFGATTTPTTTGVIAAHGGVPAGGGFTIGDGSGIIGVGGDGDDLRITTVGNATGNGMQVTVSYYTIES